MTIAVRNAIAAKMLTVPGIGQVHGFERYTEELAKFKAIYVDAGRVLGWFIRRAGWREKTGSTGHTVITYRWDIRGYMSLQDDLQSELAFDALVDQLAAAFRNDEFLGGAVDTTFTDGDAGLQLEDGGPVMFAGILCHSARLALFTRCTFEIGETAADDFAIAGIDWDMLEPLDIDGGLGPAGDIDASDTVNPDLV